MLKPVIILALDDAAAVLAEAVQRRVAASCGLDDLVQMRAIGADLAAAIESVHAQRQAPDSPLRAREDVSNRELVLLVASTPDAARTMPIAVAEQIRRLYDMRRLATYYTVELLCLLPGLSASAPEDYAAAYSLLKIASAADPRPFDAVWLLDSTNANRVKFGKLAESLETYAQAVAGALTFEPEMSGAPAAHRPRGMDPTFSSSGYAELFFPRAVVLQRVEARFSAELLRAAILAPASELSASPQLAAKQFVVGEEFAVPLSRIGVDAGQSLFRRFQARTLVTERTRGAEEVIAGVRAELKAHRDGTHMNNLQALDLQREQTAADFTALVARVVDEMLDRSGYEPTALLFEALLDPMPGVHADANAAPRNLVTEIHAATAALDQRLHFAPDVVGSEAARKRIRELHHLLEDQTLVADVHAAVTAADPIAELRRERGSLMTMLPEVVFAEEAANNAARTAAVDAESARLAGETAAREQQLRELFAAKPRAEQALREALEDRRAFIRRKLVWGVCGIVAAYGVPFAFGLRTPHMPVFAAASLYALYALVQYLGKVAPHIRAARENLATIQAHIETTDKAKNNAHNDELQFEYDVALRRATVAVLRRTRETAKKTLDELQVRRQELASLEESLGAQSQSAMIHSSSLSIAIVDDADVDAWYAAMADDRKLLFREFPLSRSVSFHAPLDDVRQRINTYAATGFDDLRAFTLADAAKMAAEGQLAQRLKRFSEYGAPLIEIRDDDIQAQNAMQRDTTLWMDSSDAAFATLIRRRLPDAQVKPAADPLRIHALSRVLHYPGYVLAEVEYYRAQYDAERHPESADAPDLLPNELLLTGALRTAYEQVLLGRAVGVIRLREDGQLRRASTELVLGDTHLAAAQRLASSDAMALRQELDRELAPRLEIAQEVERDLRELLAALPPLPSLERDVVGALIRRFGSAF